MTLQEQCRYWSYDRQYIGRQGNDAEKVLRDIIGVYSSHPSAALSLHARVKPFDEKVFNRLDEKRLALRVPAMRLSVYMLARDTAPYVFAATIPPASDPSWQKRYESRIGADEKQYRQWRKKILEEVDRPMSVPEIKKIIDMPEEGLKPLLNRMAFEGVLMRVGAGGLRSNSLTYIPTQLWIGEPALDADRDTALARLAGDYLTAFGPARVRDFQWWAGVAKGKAAAALAEHKTTDLGDGYLLPAQDLKKFESVKAPGKDSVDILPQWDTYTMGYAPDGRERFVSPDMQHHIYGKLGATGGNGLGVVLVNGLAHGSWNSRFTGTRMNVDLKMFEKPSAKMSKVITEKFEEIGVLLKAKSVEIKAGK